VRRRDQAEREHERKENWRAAAMMAHVFNLLRNPAKEPARCAEDFLTTQQGTGKVMTSKDMRRQVQCLHAALTSKETKRRR
jgi:hypothetical protein